MRGLLYESQVTGIGLDNTASSDLPAAISKTGNIVPGRG
jgi:hypothetical protein